MYISNTLNLIITLFLNEYSHNENVLFQNFKIKMLEAAIERCFLEMDALATPFWILTIK